MRRGLILGVIGGLWWGVAAAQPLPGLDALRAACVAEMRSGEPALDDPGSACQRYAEASRSAPSSVPRPVQRPRESPPVRPSPTPRPSVATPGIRVQVHECRSLRQGSIPYRRCRADEAERLRQQCRRWSNEANHPATLGEALQRARALARAWCYEAERYRIVD